METESKQTNNQNPSSAEQHKSRGGGQSGQTSKQTASPDMMTLLSQTTLPRSTCGWLSCLRKSGMSITYSMEKRHIPDMSKPRQDANTCCASSQNRGGQDRGNDSSAKAPSNGQTTGASDTMTCSGTCAIRYFDLAVGAVLVLTVCGILKGCRLMKKWF